MNRLSMRNNWLKWETLGESPIILEEFTCGRELVGLVAILSMSNTFLVHDWSWCGSLNKGYSTSELNSLWHT